MAKVTAVDCGEGQDCGSVIELELKLYAVTRTEDSVQVSMGAIEPTTNHHQFTSFQFYLDQQQAWNTELEPGDVYDVILVRRDDRPGDSVSDE